MKELGRITIFAVLIALIVNQTRTNTRHWGKEGTDMTTKALLDRYVSSRAALRELEALEDALLTAAGPGAVRLDGMPRQTGASDRTGDMGVELAEIDEQLRRLRVEVAGLETDVERFLLTVTDVRLRIILRLRYQRGMSWPEIADATGAECEDTARAAVRRYLKRLD